MFIETAIISLIVAKLRKARIKNLQYVKIKAWYLLFLASLVQLSLSLFKGFENKFSLYIMDRYFIYLHGISYLLIFICLILNFKERYIKLFLIGSLLNFLVIFANGGKMPVSLTGTRLEENKIELPISSFDIKHKLADKDTRFILLADIILIDKPYPLARLFSLGDVFLMAGLYIFIQDNTLDIREGP